MFMEVGSGISKGIYFRVMPVCCWCVRFYSGGLSAFGISIPDRPFCDCLWALYSGNGSQPYPTILGPEESGAQRLNLSQSFNGLGWILGPLVGGMLIFGGEESDPFTLTKPYILVGSVVLLVAILFIFTKLPEVQVEEDTDAEEKEYVPASGTASMWRHPQFVRAIIAQFCYCAAQTGIFSFFINYVTEVDTSMTNIEASRILAFGGMALFMIGRLSGSFTMKWMSPARLLTWFALADAVCMALVVVSVGTVSLYALYLSFFFMSIMFPTIFALGLEGIGSSTKKASSYIVMGVAGGAFAQC